MTLGAVIEKEFAGSQKAFAKKAGIDEGQLSKYLAAERGEEQGQMPSAENLARIEKTTGGRIGAAHWAKVKARLLSLRKQAAGGHAARGRTQRRGRCSDPVAADLTTIR
jgi:transcriptional regulator with XRE-family HTH domain